MNMKPPIQSPPPLLPQTHRNPSLILEGAAIAFDLMETLFIVVVVVVVTSFFF